MNIQIYLVVKWLHEMDIKIYLSVEWLHEMNIKIYLVVKWMHEMDIKIYLVVEWLPEMDLVKFISGFISGLPLYNLYLLSNLLKSAISSNPTLSLEI